MDSYSIKLVTTRPIGIFEEFEIVRKPTEESILEEHLIEIRKAVNDAIISDIEGYHVQ